MAKSIVSSLNIGSKIVGVCFLLMLVWWLIISGNALQNTLNNFLYGAALGILPIIAGATSIFNIKKWGGFKSAIGKSLSFLSAGLFTWGIGTLIFAYYNIFLNVEVPYPSLADASYILSWPLWAIGLFYMSSATGAKFQLKKANGRIAMFIVPLLTIAASYYFLIVVAREGLLEISDGSIKTFFDVAYPLGDIVMITFTALIFILSLKYLGGFFKWPILIILSGFIFNYLADFWFVYTATKETYYVANWVDLLYTVAFLLLGLGINLMDPGRISDNKDKN